MNTAILFLFGFFDTPSGIGSIKLPQPATYDRGDEARLTASFFDLFGNLEDPSAVTLKIKTPDKAVASYTPAHQSRGDYYYDFIISQSGRHYIRWEATGQLVAAEESYFLVRKSRVLT